MGDYASKGLANGVGIPALVLGSLGFLQSGGLGGIFGGNQSAMACAMNSGAVAVMAEKDAEIGQLKAEKYTNDEVAKTYIALHSEIEKVSDKVNDLALGTEKRFGAVDCQLGVMATATNNAIQSLQNTVNHITNIVIPISAICPEAMPRYNTWTAPTAEAPNTQPVTVKTRANKA